MILYQNIKSLIFIRASTFFDILIYHDIIKISWYYQNIMIPYQNIISLIFIRASTFLRGVSTDSCEQRFRRLNQYFELTRKMTQYKRNVLFWFVNECLNADLEEGLRCKQLLLWLENQKDEQCVTMENRCK